MQSYTWETVPPEQLDENIERRMIVGKKEMLVRWDFKKGTTVDKHNHPHEQVVVMVSGKLKMVVGGEETTLGPNDILVIPPDVPHEGVALEDTVVIDIFTPLREDFLAGAGPYYQQQ